MDAKITLPESDLPRSWYNILADAPTPPQPPLHPGTGQPVGPDDLSPLFPMDLILQEVSSDREIPIPEEVLDVLRLWRPPPLHRARRLGLGLGPRARFLVARRLELACGARARTYYKTEAVSPAGSHKPNTAVAQAYYSAKAG